MKRTGTRQSSQCNAIGSPAACLHQVTRRGVAMRFKFNSAVRPVTRRFLLGAAAVAAATPALSQTTAPVCPIGPPPHNKGPRVWMDMDQVELDAAYDQIYYSPLQAQIISRLASNSELVRGRLGAPRREAHCPTAPAKL